MQEAIQTFQKELKSKLEYKASSKISPDTYLYKSFKFFDLYNNGFLGKSDFFKAIAKCGVVVDTHDIDRVYNYYDTHNDGNIYYKEFIEKLLFSQSSEGSQLADSQFIGSRKAQQSNPERRQKISVQESRKQAKNQSLKQSKIERIYSQCQTYAQVANLIKRNLREKGVSSLLKLAVDLKSTDTAKTHQINRNKLQSKLTFLSQKAFDLIISQFSQGQTGLINYAELIYSLKGQLDQDQQLIVEKAFSNMDMNNEKQLPIEKVIQSFKNLPYKRDFIQSIKSYETFQGIDDGVFTDEDFIDFMGFIAFSFADSQQFIFFVEKSYLNEDARSQRSQKSNRSKQFKQQYSHHHPAEIQQTSNPDFRKNKEQSRRLIQNVNSMSPNLKNLEFSGDKRSASRKSHSEADKKSSTTSVYVKQVEMIVLRIKKRLSSKGTKGFLIFQKSLKLADADEDGLINLEQFKKVIRDLKIDITNNQSNLLFDVFDPQSTNLISYSQLIHTLKGNMPQKRREYFDRVWAAVKSSQQQTSFTQLKHSLNFRGHPDIQTGRRYDDQIFKEVQQTILLIQQLNETQRSEQISKKQFEQYFENLSLTTNEDMLFESILQNFWKMQSNVNIQDMYAGSRKLFDPASKSYLMDHHRYAVKGGSISSNAPFGTSNEPTNYFTQHGKL